MTTNLKGNNTQTQSHLWWSSDGVTMIPVNLSNPLPVNVAQGGGAGGTSSTFGVSFPGTGTAAGAEDPSGNMAAIHVDGTGHLLVAGSFTGSSASVGLTGTTAPTSADEIGWIDGSGNLQAVSAANPLPISGSITASNPSVGSNGSSAPTSSTEIGFINGSGNLVGVSSSNPIPITGSITASNPSVSGTGSAVPASATYSGMNVSGNLVGLTGTANGLKTDGSAVTQPISASSLPLPTGAATNSELVTINSTLGAPFQAGGSIGNTSFAVTQGTASSLNATVVGTGTFAVQATQAGTWNVTNVSGTVSLPTGASTSALQSSTQGTISNGTAPSATTVIGGVFNNSPPTLSTGQSAAIQVNSNGTLKVDGSGATQPVSGTFWQATQPISAASLPLPSGASTSALQPSNAAQGSTTSGQTGTLIQGAVTTASPTYTNLQTSPFSLDTSGNLRVNVVTGGGSGGTSSAFGSAFPGTGTAIGFLNSAGTNMAAGNLDASGFLKVNVAAGGAGGGAVFGATAVGSAAANPPVLIGGTANATGTGTVEIAKVDSSGNLYTSTILTAGSAAIGSITNTSFIATQSTAASLNATVVGTGTFVVQNNSATPAGTNLIGKVGIDQTTVGTTNGISIAQIGANTVLTSNGVSGTGAQRVNLSSDNTAIANWGLGATGSAVPSGAQYKAGLAKTALPTAATDGNLVGTMTDKFGRQMIRSAPRELLLTASVSATGTSGTFLASQGAGVFSDLYRLVIANSSATAVLVSILDGTNTYPYEVPANGTVGFSGPACDATPAASAATAWTYTVASATSTIYIHGQFILNK